MIRLCAAWRNTSVSRTTGTAPEPMMSASTCPGPTEGSWSTSPTRISAARRGTALSRRVHQRHVDHRDLVHDQQVALERVLLVALEAALGRVGLEQAVQGPGLEPGGLAQPLGRPAGGRRQGDGRRLGLEDLEDGVDQRGLADARPAGDHQHLRAQRQPHRLPLALGQADPGLPLDPGDRLLRVDRRPGRAACAEPDAAARRCPARRGSRPARNTQGRPSTVSATTVAVAQLQVERRVDDLGRDLQQLGGKRAQLVRRQAAMALVHGLGQRVADPGPGADHRRLLDPEPHRDLVGALEADAADVAGEPVGVLR